MDGNFTGKKTLRLWQEFKALRKNKPARLQKRWTEEHKANYLIETDLYPEYIAKRFRDLGCYFVEARRDFMGCVYVRISGRR